MGILSKGTSLEYFIVQLLPLQSIFNMIFFIPIKPEVQLPFLKIEGGMAWDN